MLTTFETQAEAEFAAKLTAIGESRTAEDGIGECLVLMPTGDHNLYRGRRGRNVTRHLRPGWPADSRGKAVFASRELAERSLL